MHNQPSLDINEDDSIRSQASPSERDERTFSAFLSKTADITVTKMFFKSKRVCSGVGGSY